MPACSCPSRSNEISYIISRSLNDIVSHTAVGSPGALMVVNSFQGEKTGAGGNMEHVSYVQ